MFGKKYYVYTPESNYGLNKDGTYLMNGEVRYSFNKQEDAINFSNELRDINRKFTLVEKGLFKQEIIDFEINKEVDFPSTKTYQGNTVIEFKKRRGNKAPNVEYGWTGKLISEEFTDLTAYNNMVSLLPYLKYHFNDFLYLNNYYVNSFDMKIVKKIFGWVYEISLDIDFNPFIAGTLNFQDMFNKELDFEDMAKYLPDIDKVLEKELDFYSYYNVACGYAFQAGYDSAKVKALKNFYNNCLSKDWEVL